jgi:2-polyprenyl-3-methyl-5-hydroxy-6-metoxy-1,4-benzoquinol methylase
VKPDHGGNELSTTRYWDGVWAGDIRLRLPSPYIVATRNLQRLLRRYVRRGDRFLEIGCAPGKILAWVAAELRADVAGLDYSEPGLRTAAHLFRTLGLTADLRCEDLASTTFPADGFDVVYSAGLIEHFADPREIVAQHLRLVRPGGLLLITVPHYGGVYGRLQRHYDAANLQMHNLAIMSPRGLVSTIDHAAVSRCTAYPSGRMSPWLVSLERRWPRPVALAVSHAVNAAALLQPMDVPALCPLLVLEARR